MPTKAKSARRATAAATAASSGYATARRVRVVRPSLQFPLIMFTYRPRFRWAQAAVSSTQPASKNWAFQRCADASRCHGSRSIVA